MKFIDDNIGLGSNILKLRDGMLINLEDLSFLEFEGLQRSYLILTTTPFQPV